MVPCPSCGAQIHFDIVSQKMVCDYCKRSFLPGELPDRTSDDAQTEAYFDSYAYICPSCGAEIDTTDKNDAVGFCPYCKGSSMIFDKLRRDWKPNGVIPFRITKEQCKELYCKEVKKHIFVSHRYRDPELIESFRGIYMPYCSFTGEVNGDVKLRAKSPEKNIGNYDYETTFYDIQGEAHYTVNETVSHSSSVTFDSHISERLDPYLESGMAAFHPAYLSGFYAETGNIDMNEYGPVIQNDMTPFICAEMGKEQQVKAVEINNNITIDENCSENTLPLNISLSSRKLFPVWFMSYRNGKKITYAAVNGQTGKVAADLPLSPLRILTAALIFSAAIFAVLFLLMTFLPTIPASATLGLCTVISLSGMYILQHCYLRTIGFALHQENVSKKLPVGFFFFMLTTLAGVILETTDGSYEQDRFMAGFIILFFSLPIWFLFYFLSQSSATGKIKKIELTNASMQSNGILVEAKKFNKLNTLMRTITFLTDLLFLVIIFDGSEKSLFYYSLAGIAAAELFILTIMQIHFQSNVAKRRLPQFNKKGAAYDTK